MSEVLTLPEVSELTRVPIETLRRWRKQKTGPVSFVLGGRVRYLRSDVEAWQTGQYEATKTG